ncbi:MAG: DUF559 domain-containing protein [Candidatus Jorgensenbacteria bacterium]
MKRLCAKDGVVLVGILKRKRDLAILLREHWYRMPVAKAPRRAFRYLAFYQPALFGRQGRRIRYYARAVRSRVRMRRELLPDEATHLDASERYQQIHVGRIQQLPRPIKNVPPRRVSFGFTTLGRLLTAKTILGLYQVAPTEEMVARALVRERIHAIQQYWISGGGKRYCLDFAIPCRRGFIAVECDNAKAHAGARAHKRDRAKDLFLRRRGWVVVRLTEKALTADFESCVATVRCAVRARGGAVVSTPANSHELAHGLLFN